MWELTTAILERFSGVALDDYSDHCWTREEIIGSEAFQGHPFFDDEGSYDASLDPDPGRP